MIPDMKCRVTIKRVLIMLLLVLAWHKLDNPICSNNERLERLALTCSANKTGADVPGADVPGADVQIADVPGVDIRGIEVPDADVPGADMPGAYVPGADFPGADVPGADVLYEDGKVNPICSNNERLEHLALTCSAYKTGTLEGMSDDEVKARARTLSILVDDAHKLLVCVPPKAGCTTWKAILANNSHQGPLPRNFTVMDLHFGKLHFFGIKYLHQLSGSDIQRVLRDYSKVIVVRHPLERVLSAYIDKLQSGSDKPWQMNLGRMILNLLGRNMSTMDAQQGKGVLFEEFLWYMKQHEKGPRNEHWASYQQACWPCSISYDKIIKLETHDADSEEIIQHRLEGRGLKTKGNAVGKGAMSASNEGHVMEPYRNMPPEQMAFLLDLYNIDMQMFGYSLQQDNITAECHNGSNNRHCC